MTKLQEMFQKYKDKQIDCFDFQENVFKFYKKSDKSEQVKQEILNIVEETLKEKTMWGVFFESDREMYKRILLLEEKNMALKCFQDNVNNPHNVLLESSAALCNTICEKNEKYSKDIEDLWLDVFKTMPNFKIALEKEKKYWQDFRSKTNENYAEYFNEIEAIKNKPIVETYQIFVPVKTNLTDLSLWSSKEMDILINELVENFNGFALHSYIDNLNKKCSKSSLEFYNGFVFKFECYERLTEEIKQVKEDFLGQLTDGWGENASQNRILIGQKEIGLDFQTEHAGDFIVLNHNKKNKI